MCDHCDVQSETRSVFIRPETLADAADDQCSTNRCIECASYDIHLINTVVFTQIMLFLFSATLYDLVCVYDVVALGRYLIDIAQNTIMLSG